MFRLDTEWYVGIHEIKERVVLGIAISWHSHLAKPNGNSILKDLHVRMIIHILMPRFKGPGGDANTGVACRPLGT